MEYKIPGESKFCMTTRPIHKLVLVVPVEKQTMEEPRDLVEDEGEEANVQECLSCSDTEEKLEEERPALESPSLAGPAPEEPKADTSGGENVGEAFGKEESPEEKGEGEKEPAETHPALKGSLKIAHHEAAEEIRDLNQALKKGRGDLKRWMWVQEGVIRRPIPQVQARGVCPTKG